MAFHLTEALSNAGIREIPLGGIWEVEVLRKGKRNIFGGSPEDMKIKVIENRN